VISAYEPGQRDNPFWRGKEPRPRKGPPRLRHRHCSGVETPLSIRLQRSAIKLLVSCARHHPRAGNFASQSVDRYQNNAFPSESLIPIEFANRPAPQPAKRTLPQPVILLIVLALVGAAMGILAWVYRSLWVEAVVPPALRTARAGMKQKQG